MSSSSAPIIDKSWMKLNIEVWAELPKGSEIEVFQKGIIKTIDDKLNTATIQKINSEALELNKSQNEIFTCSLDQIYQTNNISVEGFDDMVDMENLNEAELLYNIKQRYLNNDIFTYVGPTLLVINPYQRIEKVLSPEIMVFFQKKVLESDFDLKKMPPHVYALAALSIRQLCETKKNQAIVISGESGAGKTENAKFAMKFLTSAGKNEDEELKKDKEDSNELAKMPLERIEDKILSCNPILEAFGNSKTVRNDNSSRFGKLVILLLDQKSRKIKGAVITNYLLEKSRVIQQSESERNYHIFYHLMKGATADDLKQLGLKEMKNYEYLNKTKCYDVETINDIELYHEIQQSFKVMKFQPNEIKSIWEMVATVLHLGNIDFDESCFDSQSNKPCQILNRESFQKISELLQVNEKNLEEALTHKTRIISSNIYKTPVAKAECQSVRDSLTKSLYERIFNFLIKKLNWSISTPEYRDTNIEELINNKSRFSIGLLDIFGFEVLKKNSFEQLCINFANEKLQQLYITYVFKAELNEFIKEGLKDYLCELTYKDNKHIIDLLEGPPLGIFNLLDEASSIASTDESLLNNMMKHHKTNGNFKTPKGTRECFIIVHTAKDVEYSVTGFRIKNKDELSSDLEKVLKDSNSIGIANIFNCVLDNGDNKNNEEKEEKQKIESKSKNDKFLGAKFRIQMKNLMDELNSCDVHFIRCLKPNEIKKKNYFIPQLALNQIRYLGVLDSIKVRKESYPIRIKYLNFFERFSELASEFKKCSLSELQAQNADFKEIAKTIVTKTAPQMGSNFILFGKTKVFLRIAANFFLENALIEKMKSKHQMARKIQRAFYKMKKLRLLKTIFKSIRRIQTLYRVRKEYKKFRDKQKKLRKLQKWFKRTIFKKNLERAMQIQSKKRKLVVKLSSLYRMKTQRRKYLQIFSSNLLITKYVRGFLARRKLKNLKCVKRSLTIGLIFEKAWNIIKRKWEKEAAVVIQRYARGYLVRKLKKKEIAHMKKFRKDKKESKAGLLISRIAKGHIVRSRIRHRNYASSKIKGFIKMKWLSSLFQNVRKAVRIIQNVAKKMIFKKRVMREKWNNFKNSEIKYFESMKLTEYRNVFNKDFNEDIIKSPSKINTYDDDSNILNVFNNSGNKNSNKQGSNEKNTNKIKNEEDFMKYLDQLNEENIPSTGEGTENIEMFDEDLCERLITYDASPNTKISKEKKTSLLEIDGRKIILFSLILDLELISDVSELYKPSWSECFLKSKGICEKNNNFIQLIEFGESFTMIGTDSGIIYSWGDNEFSQLGRKNDFDQPEEISSVSNLNFDSQWKQPQKIIAGDDHCFVIDIEKNVYSWGDNYFGQLGMGNNKILKGPIKNTFLPPKKVVDIKSKGAINLCLLEDGKVLYWPFQKSTGKYLYKPIEMPLPIHITISMISCGNNFSVLLSSGGLVYTFGKENSEGQLGLGDNLPRTLPTLLITFKNLKESIKTISSGFKHTVARTGLGKVFVWGAGDMGQLGLGSLNHEYLPKQVITEKLTSLKVRVIQAIAGFKSSMILFENGNIFWWGTTCLLKNCANPVALEYLTRLDMGTEKEKINNFIPIRLLSSWSKTMSIFYVTMADTREINKSKNQLVIKKVCNTLSSYWEDQSIDPPYIESVTRHFSFKALKKIMLRQPNPDKNSKNNELNYLTPKKLTKEEKEKILNVFSMIDTDLENKPNPISNITHNSFYRVKSPYRLERFIENTKEEKLKKIKNKLINLLKTPKESWNENERKLMLVLNDSKIMNLIKNI